MKMYYTWCNCILASLIQKKKPAHLNTVIPDRMKGTKEEVFLNPRPVLVGISKRRHSKDKL